MSINKIIGQLTALGIELSVVNGKLKARLPWDKDNAPPGALEALRQAKARQGDLLEALTWHEDRAYELFSQAINKAAKYYGAINTAEVSTEIGDFLEAGKLFDAGMHSQSMQQVIAAVQVVDSFTERLGGGDGCSGLQTAGQ